MEELDMDRQSLESRCPASRILASSQPPAEPSRVVAPTHRMGKKNRSQSLVLAATKRPGAITPVVATRHVFRLATKPAPLFGLHQRPLSTDGLYYQDSLPAVVCYVVNGFVVALWCAWFALTLVPRSEATEPRLVIDPSEPLVEMLPEVDLSFAGRVVAAVRPVPRPIKEQLVAAGWRCWIVDNLLSVAPELAGQRPRGWPPPATWAQVDAVHLPRQKLVVVAQWRRTLAGERVANHRLPGVLWHELGHAWDIYLRTEQNLSSGRWQAHCSESPDFLRAYYQDIETWSAEDRRQWAYYLQAHNAGRQELYAECFALLLGSGTDHRPPQEFFARFPATVNMMRTWKQAWSSSTSH